MIYGFCLAVISGFLLAALPEWTNVKTVHGYKLMGLLVLWAIPRVLLLSGTKLLLLSSVLDLTFSACLVIAIHAFTVGGIGLATVSTMARAALGHYGAYVLAAQFAWITSYALLLWVLVRVFRP